MTSAAFSSRLDAPTNSTGVVEFPEPVLMSRIVGLIVMTAIGCGLT